MKRYQPSTLTTVLIGGAAALTVGIAGCGGDDDVAQSDLDEGLVVLHAEQTDVIVNSDGFPNLSHTCWENVGFWTTTDRVAIIVYNDWKCPGSSREQDMVVLSGNPKSEVTSGG